MKDLDNVQQYEGLEKLLEACYGNSITTKREVQARLVIRLLGANNGMSKQELMDHLGLEHGDKNDDEKLREILKPLRGGKGEFNPACLNMYKQSGETYYRLDPGMLKESLNKLQQSMLYPIEDAQLGRDIGTLKKKLEEER